MDRKNPLGLEHAQGIPQRRHGDAEKLNQVVLGNKCPRRQTFVEECLKDTRISLVAKQAAWLEFDNFGLPIAFVGHLRSCRLSVYLIA